ncbi:MAG: CHAT domain-containing protein [Planctomycetota bacterium]
MQDSKTPITKDSKINKTPAAFRAKIEFAKTLTLRKNAGDLDAAERVLRELIIEISEAPARRRFLMIARARLGGVLAELRRFGEARELLQDAIVSMRHARNREPSEFARALNALASVETFEGFIDRADLLYSEALRETDRLPREDDPVRLAVLHNLSVVRRRRGDFRGAREAAERVFVELIKTRKPGDPALRWAKLNLSLARLGQGDTAAALAVLRPLAAELEKEKPEVLNSEHLRLRIHLACNLLDANDSDGALRIAEAASRLAAELLQKGDPDALVLDAVRGRIFTNTGEASKAQPLLERAASAAHEKNLQSVETSILQELGVCYRKNNDPKRAIEVFKNVLLELQQCLPAGHPEIVRCRRELCNTLREIGRGRELEAELLKFADDVRARLLDAALYSAREAEAVAFAAGEDLSSLLSNYFIINGGAALRDAIVELIEIRRILASWDDLYHRPRGGFDESPRLKLLRETAQVARTRLAEEAARVSDATAPSIHYQNLFDMMRGRDRAQEDYRRELARAGASPLRVDLEHLRAGLDPGAALVTFLSYTNLSLTAGDVTKTPAREMLACVVLPGAPAAIIRLGSERMIDQAVGEWRAAIGIVPAESLHSQKVILQKSALKLQKRPRRGGETRGIGGLGGAVKDAAEKAGERLRAILWDPIAPLLLKSRKINICASGSVHLIPFDALPGAAGRLGNSYQIQMETSVARLLRKTPPRGAKRMLAIGGIDFGKTGRDPSKVAPHRFRALPETAAEVVKISKLWNSRPGQSAEILRGSRGTKKAFLEKVTNAEWIHLATHAYFAETPEPADAAPGFIANKETWFLQFSPMVFSSLVFSGINNNKKAAAAALTAEELAGLDLRGVGLAVLSACETNAGVRRAASGIASLRNALHAAGARASLTSLWRVSDRATCELMETFYQSVLSGAAPCDALWHAKSAAIERGREIRDWAGWVVTGNTSFK